MDRLNKLEVFYQERLVGTMALYQMITSQSLLTQRSLWQGSMQT